MQLTLLAAIVSPDDAWLKFDDAMAQATQGSGLVLPDEGTALDAASAAFCASVWTTTTGPCHELLATPPDRMVRPATPAADALDGARAHSSPYAPTKSSRDLLGGARDAGADVGSGRSRALGSIHASGATLTGLPTWLARRLSQLALVPVDRALVQATAAVLQCSTRARLNAFISFYDGLAPALSDAAGAKMANVAARSVFRTLHGSPGALVELSTWHGTVRSSGPLARIYLSSSVVQAHSIALAPACLPRIPATTEGADASAGDYGRKHVFEPEDKGGTTAALSLSERAAVQQRNTYANLPFSNGRNVGINPVAFAMLRFGPPVSGHRGLRVLCLRGECYAFELLGLPSLKGVKKLGDSALRGPDEAAGVFAGDLLKIAVDALPALPDSPEPFVIGARGAAMREVLVETSPATRSLVERSRVTDGQLGCVEVVLKAMRDPDALTAAVGAVVDTALASPDGAKLVARDKAARANDLPTGAMAALVERVWAELAPRVAAGGNLAPFLRVGLFNKAHVWTMIKQRVDATGVGIKDDVAAHVRCIRAAAEFAMPEVAALFFVGTEFLDALDAVQDVWF